MVTPNRHLKDIENLGGVDSLEKINSTTGSGVFKLDANEATIPPSPKVVASIKAFLGKKQHLNWYADSDLTQFKRELCKYTKTTSDELLVTGGSDQAHEIICNAFLNRGDEVLLPVPTYRTFRLWPFLQEAHVVTIDLGIRSTVDVRPFIKHVTRRTKIIYLINPYIWTYNLETVAMIAGRFRHALIIVDEAYYEFFGKSAIGLIRRFPNIVVTRSFSKAFMLAGVRLGYLAAHRETIAQLSKVRSLHPVSNLAEIAGIAALQDVTYTGAYVKQVKQSTHYLLEELPKNHFDLFPTSAGFVLFKHRSLSPATLQKKLEKNGVFVRYQPQLHGYLRMNVGTLAQTKKLVAIFNRLFR